MAATIDADARRKANLRVLQRIDSNIVDLAITATHVVIYEFSNVNHAWEKVNVEGSLFVTKRSDAPRFKLIVLNRTSTENLEVPITASFQMQVKDPYMIFRERSTIGGNTSDETIRGIWFHDGRERDSVASYLEQVVKSLVKIEEMERSHPPPPELVDTQKNAPSVSRDPNDDAGAALLATLSLGPKQPSNSASTNSTVDPSQQQEIKRSTSVPSPSSTNEILILDKKNLQLSLLSLIQDERFLDLIHAQYLKVVQMRAARQQTQQKNNGSCPAPGRKS